MKTIFELLTSETLKPYLTKTVKLEQLNLVWNMVMHEWSDHCTVANFEDGQLMLQVNNASWATRVRYALPEMFKILIEFPEFSSLRVIRYIINYPSLLDTVEAVKVRPQARQAYEALIKTAENVTNTLLKMSLTRLATHFKNEQ